MFDQLVDTRPDAEWPDDNYLDDNFPDPPPDDLLGNDAGVAIPAAANTPSGALALELDWATANPALLSAADLVDAAIGYEHLTAWATAQQQVLLAEFHRRPADGTVRPAATSADPAGESAVRREWAVDEIGLALTLAPSAAATRVAHADRAAAVLRPTRDLLAAGRISPDRARLIADMLAEYDDGVAEAVQHRVLGRAPEQTWGQLRAALTRAIVAVVPDPANRHQKARRQRRVELWPGRDGMATLAAQLTAPEATASFEWITRLARGIDCATPDNNNDNNKDDDNKDGTTGRGRGSMDRRRADVLVALLTGRLVATTTAAATTPTGATPTGATTTAATTRRHHHRPPPPRPAPPRPAPPRPAPPRPAPPRPAPPRPPPRTAATTQASTTARWCRARVVRGGGGGVDPEAGSRVLAAPVSAHRPLIHVTVPLTTLMGLHDEPGDFAGYGPIPAPIARQIAADPDSTWRRLLTDPVSGTLLDYGRRTYRPPAPLAGFLRARDGECRYPGCRRPAVACEIDHVQPWQHGGTTSEDNLCCLCAGTTTSKNNSAGRWCCTPTDNWNGSPRPDITTGADQSTTAHHRRHHHPRQPSRPNRTHRPPSDHRKLGRSPAADNQRRGGAHPRHDLLPIPAGRAATPLARVSTDHGILDRVAILWFSWWCP